MRIPIDVIMAAMILLIFADVILVLCLVAKKAAKRLQSKQVKATETRFIHLLVERGNWNKVSGFWGALVRLRQTVVVRNQTQAVISEKMHQNKQLNRFCRRVKSASHIRRIDAAVNLGVIGTGKGKMALEGALRTEKVIPVRLYLANALADIGEQSSIPVLVESLLGAQRWYRDKVNMLIADFGGQLLPFIPALIAREEMEIKELLVDIASVYVIPELKQYVFHIIDHLEEEKSRLSGEGCGCRKGKCCANCIYGRKALPDGNRACQWKGVVQADFCCRKYKVLFAVMDAVNSYERLAYHAADVAAKFYFGDFAGEPYLYHPNAAIRNKAVRAMSQVNNKSSLLKLMALLREEEVASSARLAISQLISKDPAYIHTIVEAFLQEQAPKVKDKLAETLSGKIEYFILQLSTAESAKAEEIIRRLLLSGKTSTIIGFLNRNKDAETEDKLIRIIKGSCLENEALEKEFCRYLKGPLLLKAGFTRCAVVLQSSPRHKQKHLMKMIYFLLAFVLLLFPAIYAVRHYPVLCVWPASVQLKTYIFDFNYYVAFYSALINLISLFLLLLSKMNVRRQKRLWSYKNISMLFKKRMLPGVSVIAPAHNEESVIIESTNSLLNLKYPDYELILVNDGSEDNTLNTLIDYYDLQRVDYFFQKKLQTEPIRGIYMNPSFPKLIVVDKDNGGKADSLNVGIMISNKEYFCCIDSDSLLEDEALLRLASQTLDEGTETPALGGNVFPINGCKVQRGYIAEIHIPQNHIARFQTIEYIRAFMAGRLGWAYMNSLLIISGAFGLFRKERVINVGGYLTSNEKFQRDTVGEDMELVVRISRQMREQRRKYRINYCYNANCWTEVPETFRTLKNQRFRWHRGLIEIIDFHRKLLFNPRYGRMGVVSMPYFFLFEVAGPLVEAQGYIMVLLALLLSILNRDLALLLFVCNILLGVLVSIASLLIAEEEEDYYSYRDVLLLVLYAVIENFGVRQMISIWRAIGYLKMFSGKQGWGKQIRKGFAQK